MGRRSGPTWSAPPGGVLFGTNLCPSGAVLKRPQRGPLHFTVLRRGVDEESPATAPIEQPAAVSTDGWVFEVTGTDPQDMADRAQRLYQEQSADIPDATEVSIEVDRDRLVHLEYAVSQSRVALNRALANDTHWRSIARRRFHV